MKKLTKKEKQEIQAGKGCYYVPLLGIKICW